MHCIKLCPRAVYCGKFGGNYVYYTVYTIKAVLAVSNRLQNAIPLNGEKRMSKCCCAKLVILLTQTKQFFKHKNVLSIVVSTYKDEIYIKHIHFRFMDLT